MNVSRIGALLLGALVFTVCAVSAAVPPVATAGAALAMGMLTLPGVEDIATLERQRVSPVGGYEVYEDFLYDTATYVAAGPAAGAQLQFFQTVRSDVTLSNMTNPGTLAVGQWFRCFALFLTPRSEPSLNVASTAAGRVADWDKIQNTARAFLNFSLQQGTKVRPAIPLEALGGLGGAVGTYGGIGTAPSMVQQLRNHAHGGFPFDITIKGGENFALNLFVGVQTAISADLPLTLWMYGRRYVPTGRTG